MVLAGASSVLNVDAATGHLVTVCVASATEIERLCMCFVFNYLFIYLLMYLLNILSFFFSLTSPASLSFEPVLSFLSFVSFRDCRALSCKSSYVVVSNCLKKE